MVVAVKKLVVLFETGVLDTGQISIAQEGPGLKTLRSICRISELFGFKTEFLEA